MSIFALINAYRQWSEKQYSMMKDGQECGLKRFWKRLKAENRNKVIIFVDHIYGIMDIAECLLLLNVKVKDFENLEASKTEILKRSETHLISSSNILLLYQELRTSSEKSLMSNCP